MRVNNDVTLGIACFSLVSTFMNELLVPHNMACQHQGLTMSTLLVRKQSPPSHLCIYIGIQTSGCVHSITTPVH